MDLSLPVENVRGVGPKTAAALVDVGIRTVGDLIYCLPRIYENYQAAVEIQDLVPGKVIVRGKIECLRTIHTSRKRLTITEGVIRDATGAIRTVWFNQPYRARQFDPEREYYFTGKYELKNGRYTLTSPSAALVQDVEKADGAAGFQPIYAAKSAIKPQMFRKIIARLRPDFAKIPDLLPMTEGKPDFLVPGARAEALFAAHFPEAEADAEQGRRYLAYEELFELILAAKLNKLENQRLKSMPLEFDAEFTQSIVKSLPFELTGAQRRATWEILQALERTTPMNRLLQGDVGSGKTIVAAVAAAQAAHNGRQIALLAPTAILATQHYEGLTELFRKIEEKNPETLAGKMPRTALLTGATTDKPALKRKIRTGEIDFVIGTHALLTDNTVFEDLAFCIIDEQHRFGVGQRQKLLLKSPDNTAPHLLSMTATPIPRSLQLTAFGDLDVSLLNELPPGRQPIVTKILNENEQRDELYPQMRELLAKGQQIYWICQLIEEGAGSRGVGSGAGTSGTGVSGTGAGFGFGAGAGFGAGTGATPVKRQVKKLAEIFPQVKVGMLHGKMKAEEKDRIMTEFAENKIQILVSTTVVEVGVNVPNANMIVIQDAEHYGLAQLHQLRGRVGRGDQPAACYLLTTGEGKPSRRLREMEKSTDGFYLAEVDLKLRGPGEIYGSMQHGELNLRVASLSDTKLIAQASHHAAEFVQGAAGKSAGGVEKLDGGADDFEDAGTAEKLDGVPDDEAGLLADYPELAARIRRYQQLTTLN